MKIINCLILVTSTLVGCASGFSILGSKPSAQKITSDVHRRDFLSQVAVASAVLLSPLVANADDEWITTESGLKYKVLKEGTGAIPETGQTVKAHYTGWLDGFDSEKKFDSSRDRNRPFSFRVGAGQVIRGWDESFSSMQVGERRQIILPPRLGYGDRGAGGIIPGGATLYFDVELLSIL
mmetsp:Transcript_28224/g.77511  ORF Transcript_28224/g.77511 Transcript_28224/m.77511 type:complete len:180 (-) Transcript_28224:29-568(-)